jgi:autophagy-related protein 11
VKEVLSLRISRMEGDWKQKMSGILINCKPRYVFFFCTCSSLVIYAGAALTATQTIYVFNQSYMEGDINEVMKLLRMQSPLQPPLEGTPPFLSNNDPPNLLKVSISTTSSCEPSELAASYYSATQTHQQSISRTLDSLQHQQSALRIASAALDLHLLDVTNIFNSVAAGTRQELDKQASLIACVDADIEMISRIPIHPDFMSPATQKNMDASGPALTLGYYVPSGRIRRVIAACRRTHGTRTLNRLHAVHGAHLQKADLQERFNHVAWTLKRLIDGAAEVRLVRSDTK